MSNEKMKLKEYLPIILLIFPFFSNYYQVINKGVYYIFIIWKIYVFLFLIMKVIKKIYPRCEYYIVALMIWMGIYTFSTVVGTGTSLFKLLGYIMTCFSTCFVLYYYIYIKKEPKKTMYALLIAFRIQVYINFILMILYPEGIAVSRSAYRTEVFRYNFIGLDNQICPYILTLLAFSAFYSVHYGFKKKYEKWLDIIVCIVSFILLESATGFLGLLVYGLVCCLMKYGRKLFTIRRLLFVVILVTISVLFIRQLSVFSEIFSLFGKDITLSGRVYIWQSAITTALKKPIWGYGMTIENIVYYPLMRDYRSAHDEYLQIILNGGIIAFLAFIYVVRCAIKEYLSMNNKKEYIALMAGLLGLLIMMITETYVQMVCFFYLISAIYYMAKYENNYVSRREIKNELKKFY